MPDRRKGVKPKYHRYLMDEERRVDGQVIRSRQVEVDADFVIRYCAPETRRFFTNLGGTEHYQCNQDRRLVISTSPDRHTKRTVLFTPIYSSGKVAA